MPSSLDDFAAVMEFRADRATRERVKAALNDPQHPLSASVVEVRQTSADLVGVEMDIGAASFEIPPPPVASRWRRFRVWLWILYRCSSIETRLDRILRSDDAGALEIWRSDMRDLRAQAEQSGDLETWLRLSTNLAPTQLARGHTQKVIELLDGALGNPWKVYRDSRYHTRTALIALDVYAEACRATGDYDREVGIADVAAHVSGVLDGFETIKYARRLVHIAEINWQRGCPHSALLTLEEAETLIRKVAGDDHPLIHDLRQLADSWGAVAGDSNANTNSNSFAAPANVSGPPFDPTSGPETATTFSSKRPSVPALSFPRFGGILGAIAEIIAPIAIDFIRDRREVCLRRNKLHEALKLTRYGCALASQFPHFLASEMAVLGSLYFALGRTTEAQQILRQAAGLQRSMSTAMKMKGEVLSRLSELHAALGELEEANVCWEEAIRIAADTGQSGLDEDRWSRPNTLGILSYFSGAYAEAGIHFSEALAAAQIGVGVDSLAAGVVMANLALALDAQGDRNAATPLREKSQSSLVNYLGSSHPAFAGDAPVVLIPFHLGKKFKNVTLIAKLAT